jgi:hypothetical protein
LNVHAPELAVAPQRLAGAPDVEMRVRALPI